VVEVEVAEVGPSDDVVAEHEELTRVGVDAGVRDDRRGAVKLPVEIEPARCFQIAVARHPDGITASLHRSSH